MDAKTKKVEVVTLTLTAREALLLHALLNGMGVDPVCGASSCQSDIASLLGSECLDGPTATELTEFCDSLHGTLFHAADES